MDSTLYIYAAITIFTKQTTCNLTDLSLLSIFDTNSTARLLLAEIFVSKRF